MTAAHSAKADPGKFTSSRLVVTVLGALTPGGPVIGLSIGAAALKDGAPGCRR